MTPTCKPEAIASHPPPSHTSAGPTTTIAMTMAMNQRPTIARSTSSRIRFVPTVIKARFFERFARERLDERDAGYRKRLLRDRFDLVALFARLAANRIHPPADGAERKDHQRYDDDRDQRQPPVPNEHGDQRGRDEHDVGDNGRQRTGYDVVHVVDVAAHPVHDLAGFGSGEEV